MKSKGLLFGLLLIGIAWIFFSHYSGAKRPAAATAQQASAPDFTLPNVAGGSLTLSSYRGKVVLLDFWATWCTPCREEIPQFVQWQKLYGDKGLQIIGVSLDDSPEPVRDFYSKFRMNYPVVMGNAKTGELYGGVLGLPIAFLVDRDGRISAKRIGPIDPAAFEGQIVKLLQASNPAKAS